jgi:hypothetical protein
MGNNVYHGNIFMRWCLLSTMRSIEVVGTILGIVAICILIFVDFMFGE